MCVLYCSLYKWCIEPVEFVTLRAEEKEHFAHDCKDLFSPESI
jgi:hypothetical protein